MKTYISKAKILLWNFWSATVLKVNIQHICEILLDLTNIQKH